MALPLGAVLCFFNLLGARAFARTELALQIRFHTPLSYPPPYPPRPIFTRYRDPTISEIESGRLATTRGGLVRETSFYKNTYAMVRPFSLPKFTSLTRQLVHGPDILSSFILLHSHQARYHTPSFSWYRHFRAAILGPHPSSARCPPCRQTSWHLAGECCCRGTLPRRPMKNKFLTGATAQCIANNPQLVE